MPPNNQDRSPEELSTHVEVSYQQPVNTMQSTITENNSQATLVQSTNALASNKQASLPRNVKRVGYVFWGLLTLFLVAIALIYYQEHHGAPDAGYAGFLLVPFVPVLFVLGIIYLILLVKYIRSPYPNKLQKLLSSIIVLIGLIGATCFAVVVFHAAKTDYALSQSYNASQNLSLQQATQLINSCKVSSIAEAYDPITVNNVATYSKTAYEVEISLSGSNASDGTYSAFATNNDATSVSNWATLVASANTASKKCGFIAILPLSTSAGTEPYTWISLQSAEAMLSSCQIRDISNSVDNQSDGILYTDQGYGNFRTPSGTNTGIALLDYGNDEQLFVDNSILPSLQSMVNSVQQTCSISGLNGVYAE